MWKIIVYSFFTVHMPWCTVHVPWTMHQALVFKKKKKRAKNTQTWKLKCECAVQTGPVYQVIGLYLLIHKSKKWSKLVGESIPIKTSKNLTFNILKPIFITYNTPLYNISYIKNSIFLIFHLNILSLLFFIHFLLLFLTLPLSFHLSQPGEASPSLWYLLSKPPWPDLFKLITDKPRPRPQPQP